MKPTTGRVAAAAALAAGLPLIAAGCSFGGSDSSGTTTQAPATTTVVETQSTAAATTTAAAPATTAAQSQGTTFAPPSGAKQLASRSQNGATYEHYSITGSTPQQVVDGYQSELQGAGYTVSSTGGGGGGWGGYGGSDAGISANNGSQWVDVQAGGSNNGPTYFEVCTGPSKQSVNDCQDLNDDDSNSKQS